ncbi:hypothetical protein BGZ58_007909 [Dissophora ornata]|nr:hypothetical protein BGZ58_007909 [Dissophora ornata]
MNKHPPPRVLISGGGLAGLFLAIILDKAGIPYHIFERARVVRSLGSAMCLNANILPAFEQLGLLEEIARISYPMLCLNLYKESLKPIGSIDISGFKEKAGYDSFVCHRPDLYNLLLSKVPPKNISFNKRVVWLLQNNEGVMIRTSDNETYHGDILVGADGAYSAVRQNLYKDLINKNELPAADMEEPKLGHVCMVGTTEPMDPEEYPKLKDKHCHFSTIIGEDKSHTWVTTTLPNNRISFSIKKQLDQEAAKVAMFRNSEWSPELNATMIKEIYNFPVNHGREGENKVLGDLIDATPPDLISKVFLEAKLFETWYLGRTVLIGDACHKMQPSAGQGAVNAMEDAVILANCLYDISDGKELLSSELVAGAFKEYQDQRFVHAKFQVENSQGMSKILNGQKLGHRVARSVIYNMPKWLMSNNYLKQAGYRPQIAFLPMVPHPPDLPIVPQKPSRRYMEEMEEKNKAG